VASSTAAKHSDLKTYYVLVEAAGLESIRGEIYRRYVERGGDRYAWAPRRYNPHISIGFTERDLFEQDGVTKDRSQCAYELVSPEGDKLTHWN
jgi:hypothetical protein